MNESRKRIVNVTILNALDASGDYALPEDTLCTQVVLTMNSKIMPSEILEHLRKLEVQRLIASTPGDEFEPTKYQITASGRLKLRGLNL